MEPNNSNLDFQSGKDVIIEVPYQGEIRKVRFSKGLVTDDIVSNYAIEHQGEENDGDAVEKICIGFCEANCRYSRICEYLPNPSDEPNQVGETLFNFCCQTRVLDTEMCNYHPVSVEQVVPNFFEGVLEGKHALNYSLSDLHDKICRSFCPLYNSEGFDHNCTNTNSMCFLQTLMSPEKLKEIDVASVRKPSEEFVRLLEDRKKYNDIIYSDAKEEAGKDEQSSSDNP